MTILTNSSGSTHQRQWQCSPTALAVLTNYSGSAHQLQCKCSPTAVAVLTNYSGSAHQLQCKCSPTAVAVLTSNRSSVKQLTENSEVIFVSKLHLKCVELFIYHSFSFWHWPIIHHSRPCSMGWLFRETKRPLEDARDLVILLIFSFRVFRGTLHNNPTWALKQDDGGLNNDVAGTLRGLWESDKLLMISL